MHRLSAAWIKRVRIAPTFVFETNTIVAGTADGFAIRAGEVAVQLSGLVGVVVTAQREVHAGDGAVINAVGDIFRALRCVDGKAERFKILRALHILERGADHDRRVTGFAAAVQERG